MSIYIGEGSGQNYSAMQGPCDSGFHIPTKDEMQALIDIGVSLGAWDTTGGASNISQYLKLPPTGYRSGASSTASKSSTTTGYYYTSKASNSANAYYMSFYTNITVSHSSKTSGRAIRPFKDIPVIPDSNRTTLYAGTGDAGIFHNSTLGLISISDDGDNWITIADKNLGATTVWNYGDTGDANNTGGFYQRGNNYMFPYSGSVTTSPTQVDASDYGPGNYYSSSTFIYNSGDWSSVRNDNLRGGVTGITKNQNVSEIYIGEGKDSYEAMRGPCLEGFHVPSGTELQSLVSILQDLSIDRERPVSTYLKLPNAGYLLYSNASSINRGSRCFYASSDTAEIEIYDGDVTVDNYLNKANGVVIRPFYDQCLVPDNSRTMLYDGSSVVTGAGVFYNSTLGVISLSSDGTNWITISDKNAGATTVYNYGDSLTNANCGKYYQRGNNYGFSYSYTPTTSSTKIDASGYGPGNYYSSSTFIIVSSSPFNWDSSNNTDLRGGTTGITKKGNVIEVYQGTTKIRTV